MSQIRPLHQEFLTSAKGVLADKGYVCNLDDFAESAVRCINLADMARTTGYKYVNAIAHELGLNETSIHVGKKKEPERITEKTFGRYQGRVDQLSDLTRFMVELEDNRDVIALRKLMSPRYVGSDGKATMFNSSEFNRSWERKGVTLVEMEDSYAVPTRTGYMALNNKYRIDLGKSRSQMIEVQYVHKDMMPIYEITHKFLEARRSIVDGARADGRPLTRDEKAAVMNLEQKAKSDHYGGALGLNLFSLMSKQQQKDYMKPQPL